MPEPTECVIKSEDWWVKVLGMLQQNWALVDEKSPGKVEVYFFHDGGYAISREHNSIELTGWSGIIDRLTFQSREEAADALFDNGFDPHSEYPGPWDYMRPNAPFFDCRNDFDGPYSNGEYWHGNMGVSA